MMSPVAHHDAVVVRNHIYYHLLVTCAYRSVTVPGYDCDHCGDDGGLGGPMDPVHRPNHCDSHNSEIWKAFFKTSGAKIENHISSPSTLCNDKLRN